MDEPTRRAWSRPELIVLVWSGAGRGGAEEDVLMGCKVSGIGDMQPFDVLDGCNIKEECGPCTFMGRS